MLKDVFRKFFRMEEVTNLPYITQYDETGCAIMVDPITLRGYIHEMYVIDEQGKKIARYPYKIYTEDSKIRWKENFTIAYTYGEKMVFLNKDLRKADDYEYVEIIDTQDGYYITCELKNKKGTTQKFKQFTIMDYNLIINHVVNCDDVKYKGGRKFEIVNKNINNKGMVQWHTTTFEAIK